MPFFTNVVDNLDIQKFDTIRLILNFIKRISLKNLKTILENVQVDTKFHFDEINEAGIKDNINSLDKKSTPPLTISLQDCL